MRIEIQGGRVIDPGKLDAQADILIERDKIVKITRFDKWRLKGRPALTMLGGRIVYDGTKEFKDS